MSDEHNADEPSKTNDSTASINRRRFVKSLGVAGGVSAFSSFGAQSVAASGTASGSADMQVTEVTPRKTSNVEVNSVVSSSSFVDQTRRMARFPITEPKSPVLGSGTGPGTENGYAGQDLFSYDIATDNENVNATDPVLSVEMSVQEPGFNSASNSAGMVYTLTARNDQGRGLIGGLSATVDQFEDYNHAKTFGVSDDRGIQMTDDKISNTKGVVTTESIGCGGCKNAVDILCGIFGGGVAGLTCTYICSPTAPIPPIFVDCDIDCTIILGAIVAVGCSDALSAVHACQRAGYC